MDVKREVQHRSPLWQLANITVGREYENLTRCRLGIEALRKRVCGLLQSLTQAAQPLLRGLRTLIYTLVTPVCGDTSLRHSIHSLGAYLYLHPATSTCRYGGVQRLVTILLWDGHPVTHTLWVGGVAVAHHRIYRPAELLLQLLGAVDNHTQREDVVNTLEAHILLAHLVPDGIYRLGAALDVVVEVWHLLESLLDRLQEACDECLSLALGLLQSAADIFVVLVLQPLQSQILQLALQGIKTQLVSNLRI